VKLSPEKLAISPELASLAVLDTALDMTTLALAAAWPELQDGLFSYDEPRAALEIIELARALAAALRRYRRALVTVDRRELDLPF
jgi:hypothetical protein